MTLNIRPATPDDLVAALDIYNAVYPDHAETLEETEHFLAQLRDSPLHPHFQDWMAEVGGKPVGTARLWQAPWMFHPDRYHLDLMVLPEFRGQGIGGALFGAVRQHWQERGAKEVLAGAKETETHALAMLERRGFAEVMRFFDNVLRLENFDAAQWQTQMTLPQGVRAVTFADLQTELGEDAAWQAYYACQSEARLDVPRTAPPSEVTLENFRSYRSKATFDPAGVWLAVTEAGEAVAGAGDRQHRAGDVAGLVRGQEADRRRLLVERAVAAQHRVRDRLVDVRLVPLLLLIARQVRATPRDATRRRLGAPGAVAATRMPASAYSRASEAVIALIAPLAAE